QVGAAPTPPGAGLPPGAPAPAPEARGWRASRARFARWLDGAPLQEGEIPGMDVFEREAEEVMSRQHTARAQRIARMAFAAVVALFVWAGFAKVDEVTRGDGRVVPSRQLQVLQSLDGGVVEQILAQEGQTVEAGQLLLKVDPTRATSAVRDSAAQ